MQANNPGVTIPLGIIEGGGGAILTADRSSSPDPSQFLQLYLRRTILSPQIWGGMICNFSAVSSPKQTRSHPHAHSFPRLSEDIQNRLYTKSWYFS